MVVDRTYYDFPRLIIIIIIIIIIMCFFNLRDLILPLNPE